MFDLNLKKKLFLLLLGVDFPRNFITVAKTILKRLFRVYAHVYHAHFEDILHLKEEVRECTCTTCILPVSLHSFPISFFPSLSLSPASLQAHLNTSFKHLMYFVHEFNLIDKRELTPMQDLIDKMLK